MDKIIQNAMNDEILAIASKLYGFDKSTLKNLGGFENHVFEYKIQDKEYILRFVHSIHRSFEYVLAEIEFIDYLACNGASVSTIIHSKNDQLVEKVELNNQAYFTIGAFTKAPGDFAKKEDFTEEFFYLFGKEVGLLHRLTKEFEPTHKRYHWYEEDYIDECKEYIPKEDWSIIDKSQAIIEKIKTIPKNKDNYGLIHTDLHFHNMFYDNGTFTFFDFDDSSYKYFVSDIAIVLYYYFVFSDPQEKDRIERTKWLLQPFLKGYEENNKIDKKSLNYLNDFLKLRETVLYLVVSAHNEGEQSGGYNKFLAMLKHNIDNNISFYESLDFLEELL